MLIRFVVSNFLSFGEETEFTMLAGSFKTHKAHVYNMGKIDVLKAAAIYGANGAGKSNLVKAIDFLQETVKNGGISKSVNDKKFKLNKANADKPISLEIEFSIDNKPYSYGFSLTQLSVTEEWLYETGLTEAKLVFERKQSKNGQPSIKVAEKYRKTKKSQLLFELMEDNLLKNNELLLGKTESLKIDEFNKIRNWIENDLKIIYPKSIFDGLIPRMSASDAFTDFANDLLRTLDTGVNELGIETIDMEKFFGEDEQLKKEIIEELSSDNESITRTTKAGVVLIKKEGKRYVVKKLVALHKDNNGTNVSFDLTNESDGTQRLLDFIPAFEHILARDVTIIIDEIDQSLHPTLLYSLVHKIMTDDQTRGQFVFSTHESSLLDLTIFRQDEIWFAEKNKDTGSTQLYSLSEFKPRYDLDIRKGYLKGRFGAIPFLARLEDLNWHTINGV
jgi:uncharacterized protein